MQVLIVDDDHDTLTAISETLEMEGHRTTCVSNGQVALEYLRTGAATCVILLDLMMPAMNGWQFREQQLQETVLAGVPLVLITADANPEIKAAELSADRYLRKPLKPEQLIAAVAKYCADRA
jgi:CheY-like chemotaxis protein